MTLQYRHFTIRASLQAYQARVHERSAEHDSQEQHELPVVPLTQNETNASSPVWHETLSSFFHPRTTPVDTTQNVVRPSRNTVSTPMVISIAVTITAVIGAAVYMSRHSALPPANDAVNPTTAVARIEDLGALHERSQEYDTIDTTSAIVHSRFHMIHATGNLAWSAMRYGYGHAASLAEATARNVAVQVILRIASPVTSPLMEMANSVLEAGGAARTGVVQAIMSIVSPVTSPLMDMANYAWEAAGTAWACMFG